MSTFFSGQSIWAATDRTGAGRYYIVSTFGVAVSMYYTPTAPLHQQRFYILSPCCHHEYLSWGAGPLWTCGRCDGLGTPQLDIELPVERIHDIVDFDDLRFGATTREVLEAMATLTMDPLTAMLAVDTFERVFLDFVREQPWDQGGPGFTGARALAVGESKV